MEVGREIFTGRKKSAISDLFGKFLNNFLDFFQKFSDFFS